MDVHALPSVCFTSLRTSTERQALCYCCNEPGICSPPALSPRLTDKWSCTVSCPPLPLPSASSARSVQPRRWRDWPTILGATCQSARADWPPLCAGTVERELNHINRFNKQQRFFFFNSNKSYTDSPLKLDQIRHQPFWIWPGLLGGTCNPPSSWQKPSCECSVWSDSPNCQRSPHPAGGAILSCSASPPPAAPASGGNAEGSYANRHGVTQDLQTTFKKTRQKKQAI